jgi:hypothetical protein
VDKSQDRVLEKIISRSYPDTLLPSQGISGSGVKKKSTSDQIRAAKECLLKHVLAFFLRATGRSCIARLLSLTMFLQYGVPTGIAMVSKRHDADMCRAQIMRPPLPCSQ